MRNLFQNRQRTRSYIITSQLIIPAIFLAYVPRDQAIIGLALILVLGVLHLLSFHVKSWTRLWVVLGQVAIIIFIMDWIHVEFIWLVFFPAGCLGAWLGARRLTPVVGGLVTLLLLDSLVAIRLQHVDLTDTWPMVLAPALGAISLSFLTMYQTQTQRSKAALEAANSQIERLTKVAERERISQDLHDVMGHELSMITLKSQLVERLIDRDPAKAKSEIRDIEQAARQALTRVREYIADMRQPKFNEEWADGIKLLQAAGIDCRVEQTVVDLDHPVYPTLAMCIREAITNIVRHSRAKRVWLSVSEVGGIVQLIIADDGIGLIGRRDAGDLTQSGHGLRGIRARLAAIDGSMSVRSNGDWVSIPDHAFISPPFATGLTLVMTAPLQAVTKTEETIVR